MSFAKHIKLFKDRNIIRIVFSLGYLIITSIALSRILPGNKLPLLISTITTLIIFVSINFKMHTDKTKLINSSNNIWVMALSCLISLFSIFHLIENANFNLTSFPQRTIGAAILEGIDIPSRSFLYIFAILDSIVVFTIVFFVFSRVEKYTSNIPKVYSLITEKKIIFYISLLSAFTLVIHYINGAKIYINIFDILLLIIWLTYLLILGKVFLFKRRRSLFILYHYYDLVVFSFIFPLVIFFIRWVFVNGSFIFSYRYFAPYIFLWALYWLIIYFIVTSLSQKKVLVTITSILSAAVPFLFIPISIPIANEVQFSTSNFAYISALSLSIIFILILIILCLITFFRKLNRADLLKNNHFAARYFLPTFLATLVMFNVHKNFVDLPSQIDMFHHGENLLPIQQLFSFGKIPFIHLFPTHGISYLIGQFLFSLINGYRAFEPWLWEWVTKIFEIILLYSILKQITKSSIFSTVIIAFVPILGIFGGKQFVYGYNTSLVNTYFFSSFFAALSLGWVLAKPNYRKLKWHWLVCFFLIAWRVDFGISSIATSIIILVLFILSNKFHGLKSNINVSHIIRSLIFITGIFTSFFIILALAYKEQPLNIITQIIQFVKIQASAQGLIQVFSSTTPLTIIQYFLLPSIAVFYVLFFIVSTFKKPFRSYEKTRWILLFLAIFSLIISLRSIQRQTLAVLGYNPYLFVFLGLSLPYYLNIKKNISAIIFILLLLAYQLFFQESSLLLKTDRVIDLYNWRNKETRVHINDRQYKDLSGFLTGNLNGGQTFLDLTSSPLLYIVTDKKFINYLIPSAYYTSELVQKNELSNIQKVYLSGELPLIIFKQPNKFANNIDGVPNEIRSYRIYEFIYQNYRPMGYVNGFFIWGKNDYNLEDLENFVPIEYFKQDFDLKMLPYIWATYDIYNAIDKTEIIEVLANGLNILKDNSVMLSIKPTFDKTSGNYLDFRINANAPGKLKISYGHISPSIVTLDYLGTGKEESYLIRISSQWAWISQKVDSINIESSSDIKVTQAFIRKGD